MSSPNGTFSFEIKRSDYSFYLSVKDLLLSLLPEPIGRTQLSVKLRLFAQFGFYMAFCLAHAQ